MKNQDILLKEECDAKEQSRSRSIPSCLFFPEHVTRGHVLIKDKFCTLLNSVQPIFCSLIQRPLIQQIQRKSCFNLRKDFTDLQQRHQICVMFTEFCKIKFDKFCLFRLSQSVPFLNTTKQSKF